MNISRLYQFWPVQGTVPAMFLYLVSILACLSFISAASVRGRLDIGLSNITGATLARSEFKLYQIGNYSNDLAYSAKTYLKNTEGDFSFENLPLNHGVNASTYFVLTSSSLDFNLKPNRILCEFINQNEDGSEYHLKAYKNIFGKEYFPSPDITYPEQLEALETEPFISIELINRAPLRLYYQQRNKGLFTGGPFASLLNARWKQALAVMLIGLILLPILLEKFDPATAKAIQEEKLKKQREKYQS